jgi:hypothetical protein
VLTSLGNGTIREWTLGLLTQDSPTKRESDVY